MSKLEDDLKDAARTGVASGVAGFLVGGTAGILKNTTPVLFGIASFIQCGCLGSTFWFSRTQLLRNDTTPLQASAFAGAMSGGITAFTFRGPKNILPGIICIAAFGAAGQAIYDRSQTKKERTSMWQTFTTAKWSPVQSISDEKYSEMLREQLLKNQIEVAILDDKITALKRDIANDEQSPAKPAES